MNLALKDIALDDASFDLGFARAYEALRRSVAEVGVLQPLVLRKNACEGGEPPGQIVCGFGRAKVARELGLQVLPACVLEAETTDADCLRLALFDNLGHRAFNPIERATILSRLEPQVGRERLITDYMPLLGLKPSGALLDRTTRLTSLESPLKLAVTEGRIEERVGVLLARLPSEDQKAFARVIERCRPSVSIARELIETLADLARRDNRSVFAILAAPEIAKILEPEDMKPVERVAALREHLRRLRYPAVSAHEQRFTEARDALRLPPSMRLDHAPAFESDEMRLEIRFRSPDELKQAGQTMSRWLDDPSLLDRLWPAAPETE